MVHITKENNEFASSFKQKSGEIYVGMDFEGVGSLFKGVGTW